MGQADPILTKLGAGPAVKKLVETALALSSSADPQQRNHAYSFMESAIKELEDENQADPGLGPDVDDGISAPKLKEEEDDNNEKKLHEEHEGDDVFKKLHEQDDDKDDHKLHEEVLDNHNNGPREDGSEQSTDNVAPYPAQGVDTTNGEKPMQDMDGTVNQWSETNGMIVPGLPPIQNMGMGNGMPNGNMGGNMGGNGNMGGDMGAGAPGLMPDIAREMGAGMPAPPPMDTNQMMRQMQYTVQQEMRKYHNKVVIPLNRIISQQRDAILKQREAFVNQKNAIKKLSVDIREAVTNNGSMKLDLDTLRQNATAKFRETTAEPSTPLQGFAEAHQQSQTFVGVQPLPNYQRNKITMARSEIENMDKMLNQQKNPMYN